MVAPLLAMVPSVELPPETPLTSQEIAPPVAPQKDAVKVCDWASETLAEGGASEFAEQVTVTLAVPDLVASATLVAAMVTVAGDGGTEGAV